MSLQFIIGRAGSGKTHYCMEEIKKILRQDPRGNPLILLVPEQATYQNELALAKDPRLGGLIRIQVLSFERLTWRLLQEVGGSARIHLSDLGKKMVLRKIIEESKDKLKVFKRAAGQVGFVEGLAEALSELKRYNASPERIAAKLGEKNNPDLLQAKLHDLIFLYNAMEAYLATGYLDPDDHLLLLAQRIEGSQMLKDAYIWMDGYTGFTPQEFLVLEKLLATAREVKITFCIDAISAQANIDEDHLFYPIRLTMDKLTVIAEKQGIDLKSPIILNDDMPFRFQRSPDLYHVEKHFFATPLIPFEGAASNVCLIGAANPRAEVEAIARDIRRLCREKGLRYRDIALLLRDLEPYHQLIITIFQDYQIPFFIDQKRTVMHHPLVELLRSALEVITSHFNYEPIFRYLKTDLTILGRDQVDILENYCLAYGIRGSKWTDGKPWSYRKTYGMGEEAEPLLTKREKEELERINSLREHAVRPLLQLERRLKKAKNVKELTKALFQLLIDLKVPEELSCWKSEAEVQGLLEVAREHSQVWNETLQLFDQVVEALGEEKLSVNEYRLVLESGFASMRLSLIPPGLDQVLISILGHSRSPEIKAAYILGVNDGLLPARNQRQGLFSEVERELLSHRGIELAPSGRQQLFEEQYITYTALTRASTYLWLSYALADEEGRALMPSQIVSRLKILLPSLQERFVTIEPTDEPDSSLNYICHEKKTLTYLVSQLREAKAGKEIHPIWWEVYNYYMQAPKEKSQRILKSIFHRNSEGFIPAGLTSRLFGPKLRSSVSRLEKFAACPFAHFSAYGLRLEERTLYKLGAPDLGQFFHASLKEFAEYLQEQKLEWSELSRENCRTITSQVVEKLLPKLQNEILLSTNRYRYLSSKLKRILERSALVLTEHARRGKFRPIGVELGFGMGEKLPPLICELGNGLTLELTGRIDRVDMAVGEKGNYFRIIDYKSSLQKLSLEEIYYGLKLQLLVYLEVILENAASFGEGQGIPAGLLYFPVKDPLISAETPISAEKLEEEILKKLKMQGFVLGEPQVVKMMDETINGHSQLIPAALTKDGTLYANVPAFSPEQFILLRHHLRQTLQNLGRQIIAGNVQITPYRRGNDTACRFCKYKSVCQFDVLFEDNVYRLLGKNKEEDIWLKIKGGEKHEQTR